MLDVDALKEKLAAIAAEEADEAIPDGFVQKLAGEAIVLVAEALAQAGMKLATEQNEDQDK